MDWEEDEVEIERQIRGLLQQATRDFKTMPMKWRWCSLNGIKKENDKMTIISETGKKMLNFCFNSVMGVGNIYRLRKIRIVSFGECFL